MKSRVACLSIFFVLFSTTYTIIASTKQSKPFKVPEETLASINQQKKIIRQQTYNNAVASNHNETEAQKMATAAAISIYNKLYKQTDEYKKYIISCKTKNKLKQVSDDQEIAQEATSQLIIKFSLNKSNDSQSQTSSVSQEFSQTDLLSDQEDNKLTTAPTKQYKRFQVAKEKLTSIKQQKKIHFQKIYDQARADNHSEIEAEKIARASAKKIYHKLYIHTDEYKMARRKTDSKSAHTSNDKEIAQEASSQLIIKFSLNKLNNSPSQISSSPQKVSQIDLLFNQKNNKLTEVNMQDKNDNETISKQSNSTTKKKRNPFACNFKTCFNDEFSDATSSPDDTKLYIKKNKKRLYVNQFKYDELEDISLQTLKNLVPELSNHKKRKQPTKS